MRIVLLMFYFVVINSEFESSSETVRNRSGKFQARMVSILLSRAGRPFDQELVQPAVAIAQKTIRKFYPNIDLQVVFLNGTSGCTANYAGAMAAEQYYRHYVSGFLGPGCSLALDPVARMAARWSIPVCTAAGSNSKFGNKKDFATLTRLSHTMGGVANTALSVFRFFGWHHVAILYDGAQDFSSLVASSLERALRSDLNFTFYLYRQEFNSLQKNIPFEEMLETAAKSSRVFFIAANGETVREILLVAHDLGMGNGEFAFLTVELFKNERSFGNFSWYHLGDTRNQDARAIYDSLFSISIRAPEGQEYQSFAQKVITTSWTDFGMKFTQDAVNFVVAGFHDCVLMYAWALNRTLADGDDPSDGPSIIRKMWNNTFRGGITGDIIINANGDRETDYTLNELDEKYGEMKPVAIYFGFNEKFQLLDGAKIHWPGGRTSPPPDVPWCGFLGDEPKCYKKEKYSLGGIVSLVTACLIFVGMTLAFLVFRRLKLESELLSQWWKVKWEDIVFTQRTLNSTGSLYSISAMTSVDENKTKSTLAAITEKADTNLALYKGQKVVVKRLQAQDFKLTREVLMELKQRRDTTHENLVRFIGLSLCSPYVAILTELCPRGSLQEMLLNKSINMDWTLKFSISTDIVEGMLVLHESQIVYHGNLRSSTCVIDSRFAVKLSNFGLRKLLTQTEVEDVSNLRQLLWTAPEHLRKQYPISQGSQKGDVYSFAIILQEIITRTEPYDCTGDKQLGDAFVEAEDILQRVRSGTYPPYRPRISPNDCPNGLWSLLHHTWAEDPASRPNFSFIKQQLKQSNIYQTKGNFLDCLLSRMENYANNLEQLVEEKTEAVLVEKRKSEELLYEVLPRYVAEQLKSGNHVRPETFECVTIYFSDIVGFTALSAESSPMEVVDLLNDLYTCFDKIIGNYDVYKVETIGDAYMVVSGLPVRNGNEHVRQVARMSLSLLKEIEKFRIRHRPNQRLQLRIGLHSGSCVAGVVGLKMPRYCLFGDTVNTASRMESSGQAMKVHVSNQTKELLQVFGTFRLAYRGQIELKGKGLKRTYWLEGEDLQPRREGPIG